MIPIALGVAAVATSLYSAYKQGQISEDQLAQQQKMLEDYKRELDNLPEGAPPPVFTPELYQVISTYKPEFAQQIEEEAPELVTEQDSVTEKGYQRDVLNKLSNLSQTGSDAISDAAREQAAFEADSGATRRRNEIVKQMAQRGLGGSGADILTQLQSSQDEAVNQRQAAMQAAADAQSRRYSALNQLGSLSGQVRSQNTNVEEANRNVMNAFKQRTSNARNQYQRYLADTQNDAQLKNMQAAQAAADNNVGLRNTSNLGNMTRAFDTQESRRKEKKGDLASMFGIQRQDLASQGAAAKEKVGNYATAANVAIGAGSDYYQGESAKKERSEQRDWEADQREKDRQSGYRRG